MFDANIEMEMVDFNKNLSMFAVLLLKVSQDNP